MRLANSATLHILCHRCGADRLDLPDEAAGRRCGAAADMSALPRPALAVDQDIARPRYTYIANSVENPSTRQSGPALEQATFSNDSALWASRSFLRKSDIPPRLAPMTSRLSD